MYELRRFAVSIHKIHGIFGGGLLATKVKAAHLLQWLWL